jgi:hypothetical protein
VKLITVFLLTTACVVAQTSRQPSLQQSDDEHFLGVQQRGESHQGMGFNQMETTHHFILTPQGGYIQVTANDPKDHESIEKVQSHFAHIAALFAKGDFAIPHFVHAQNPPGVKTMKRLNGQITYSITKLDDGAQLLIATKSPQALAAIHDFLRFQIKDHHTGDPLKTPVAGK